MTKFPKMKLWQCLMYLLFVVFTETMLCYPSERLTINSRTGSTNSKATRWPQRLLNMKETIRPEGSTLNLIIYEDSDSVESLANKVLAALDLTFDTSEHGVSKASQETSYARRRRTIFGIDNRVNVRTSREAQMYPYSTAVMLSSGCTGTLIGSQHVLTAAHCVHNGRKTLKSAKSLKIGLLQRSGKFHWIRVKKIYIPKEWKKQAPPPKSKLKYDFAVLHLKRQHNRRSMAVQTSSLLPGSKIQFSGFHADKWYNTLWYSYCPVYRKSHDMIINFCDGVKGISGSGVYVDTPNGHQNAVVGIVAATAQGNVKGKVCKFNVVNSLTNTKVMQITKWVSRS